MQYRVSVTVPLVIGTVVHAIPARPQITSASRLSLATFAKRSQPEASGSSVLDAPMTIAAGDSFDGGNYMFDRGVSCTGQEEGGDSDAVFILEQGASLSNVIIGPNQVEGVHCNGGCTITNVWWDAVCEDAFSIKKQESGETTTINGGGATGAEDKVVQHNGGGTVVINDFTVSDFGKLYRSCGNCDDMPDRHVRISGGSASDGDVLVGINTNMGDTASISGMTITNVESECLAYEGVTDGSEPEEIGTCNASASGTGSVSDVVASTTATPGTTTISSVNSVDSASGTGSVSDVVASTATPGTTTISSVTSFDSFSTPTAVADDGSYDDSDDDSDESTDEADGDESSDDNEDNSVRHEDGNEKAFNFGYFTFGSR